MAPPLGGQRAPGQVLWATPQGQGPLAAWPHGTPQARWAASAPQRPRGPGHASRPRTPDPCRARLLGAREAAAGTLKTPPSTPTPCFPAVDLLPHHPLLPSPASSTLLPGSRGSSHCRQ